MTLKLLVGDEVTWTSQAGGVTKTKTGKVVHIVPPGEKPTDVREPGMRRDHESYIVRALGRRYWPRVSHLAKVKQ
jgi:hypothetical protein